VQTILDQLMPGLVPLLLTFACMWLLRKKVNPLWIIVGFFVIGIAATLSACWVCNNPVIRRGLPRLFYLEDR
jgi:mannose/fructose/N-acetylgalactosamine-specific phosphotransferase system component IID